MLSSFIKKEGERFIFTGNYMEAYIPEFYFQGKMGEMYGNVINVFGLFNVRCFDAKDKPMKMETLNLPTMILMYPSEIVTDTLQLLDVNGEDDAEETKYVIARFYNGDVLTHSSLAQDSTNVELFLSVLTSGKVPNTIPYGKILQVWHENLTINNVRLGVTSAILEIIITETYRNKKTPEETFAKQIGRNPNMSEYAYRAANNREISARNSTFSALIFEDMDQMITSSLNISSYKRKESRSPLEKIIKM